MKTADVLTHRLEGLSDPCALARASEDDRAERYRRCLCAGLANLLRLQRTGGGTVRERGGFGLRLGDRMQRIDITGHAAGAFMTSVENGIECGAYTDVDALADAAKGARLSCTVARLEP